jgi:hypothetical protein
MEGRGISLQKTDFPTAPRGRIQRLAMVRQKWKAADIDKAK